MMKLGEKTGQLYGGKYLIDAYSTVYYSVFDGGSQLFFGENNRTLFIDLNSITKQCYGVSIILEAYKYHKIEYNLPECENYQLFYDGLESDGISICKDLNLKCFFDIKNKLILIGDPAVQIKPICFFDNTYAVVDNQKLKLLILKVEEDIINEIIKNKLALKR